VSWLITFAGFAALIMLHEFGHFAVAKAVGMRVERFMLFFPPIIWSVKRGETEYGIGCIPLGGYVKITGMTPREELPEDVAYRAYHRQPVWKRVAVIIAGPVMNLIIAFGIIWALFVFSGRDVATNQVDTITTGAAAAGILKPGDRLVAVDGVRGDAERLRKQIGKHGCSDGVKTDGCNGTPAKVTIARAGKNRTFEVAPRYDADEGRPLLGFTFVVEKVRSGAVAGVGDAVDGMWWITKKTVSTFGKLFYDSEARKQVGSVVGGFEATRQAVNSDLVDALQLLAIISLSLAIINLFPFLPLDGGHVFWALAEKVRRKPIPFAVMERASVVGFMLVIAVFIIGLTNDIDRLRGEGFGIR
jgi:regulator of sigma E protease